MSEHRSQHFVPQHYLRGFSENGRTIRLCHLKSGKIIHHASLRDQCARNYFYGQDRRIERVLAQLEGGDETVLRGVRETLNLPPAHDSRGRLSLITAVLSGRTAKAIERERDAFKEIMAESARRLFKMHRLPLPSEAEIRNMLPKDNFADGPFSTCSRFFLICE